VWLWPRPWRQCTSDCASDCKTAATIHPYFIKKSQVLKCYNIKLYIHISATTITNHHKQSHCEQCLKYLLVLRTFVAVKLPEDGTLVPKHVAVASFVIYFILFSAFCWVFLKKRGKAIPLQAWTGPGGSRRLTPRFHDNRHKVVRLSALRTGRFYPPRKYSWYSLC
jgi:hypothetical protein